MRHTKSRSVKQIDECGVRFWLKRYAKVKVVCCELKVLASILGKGDQEFAFLAFHESIAHRIISRSEDILRVSPGESRCASTHQDITKNRVV